MKTRFLIVLILTSLVLILSPPGASAGKGWCRSDPIVNIGGTIYEVEAYVDFGSGGYATSPDLFVFYTDGLSFQLLHQDNGVDGNGEIIRNYSSDLEGHVGVRVHISTNTQYPMYITVNDVVVASGTTNSQFRIHLN